MPFLHFIAHEFATRHFLLFAIVAAAEGGSERECIRHLDQRMRADKLSTVGRLKKKHNYNNN